MNLTLLATEGFGLNFNLFETNILNWAVVVFGLYKFLPGFLGKMLQKRREGILLELKDAEDRLLNATQALEKAKKDLSSAEKKEDKKEDIKTISEKSFDLKQINKKLLYAIVVVVVLLAIYLLK